MMKLLLAAAIVLPCMTAFADAKYTRKPTLNLRVTISDRVKPTAPPPSAAKPLVTADDVMRGHEVTQVYRKEQEAILEELVAEMDDDDPETADMLFRLAEHYAKQHRFFRHQSIAPTMPPPARTPPRGAPRPRTNESSN